MDELDLEPWVSLWSSHFGEEPTPPLGCTEWDLGCTEWDKMPSPHRLEGGEQGVPERQIHFGGGARSGPRGVREITPPPLMATSWEMTRRYRGRSSRIEFE